MNRKEQLRAVHFKRSEATVGRIVRILSNMEKEELPITFQSVARMAGMCVGTLYYHREIRSEIMRLREAQRTAKTRKKHGAGIGTAAELYREIGLLQQRIAELEEEVRLEELLLDREYCYELFVDDG